MGGNNECFENFERNKYLKILSNMQRVNYTCIKLQNFAKFDLNFTSQAIIVLKELP